MNRLVAGLLVLGPCGCGSTVTPLGDAGLVSAESGFEISGPATLRTHELGVSDTIFVALSAKPIADVVLSLSLTDESEGALSVGSLRFTPLNWKTPQRVQVTGVSEAGLDGDVEHELHLSILSNASGYSLPDIEPIPIVNEDFVIERVSVPAPDFVAYGHRGTGVTALSNGGRQVVFETGAALVAEDENDDVQDVYIHDRDAGVTELVSAYTGGGWDMARPGWVAGKDPAITPDGRHVSFISSAPLGQEVGAPGEWTLDIYVSDRHASDQPVERVTDVDRAPRQTALSANGRFIAFGGYSDSFSSDSSHLPLRYDRLTGTIDEGFARTSSKQLPVTTTGPAISADGTTMLFTYISRRMIPGVGQSAPTFEDFYETGLVDFNADAAAEPQVFWPSEPKDLNSRNALSEDGATLAFSSDGNLVVANMDRVPYVTRMIGPGRWASLSSDGRYLAFQSGEDYLNNRSASAPEVQQVFVADLLERTIAQASLDDRGNAASAESLYPTIAPDGTAVSFSAASDDLVADDDNGIRDAFVVELDDGFWHTAVELPYYLIAPTGDGWARVADPTDTGSTQQPR